MTRAIGFVSWTFLVSAMVSGCGEESRSTHSSEPLAPDVSEVFWDPALGTDVGYSAHAAPNLGQTSESVNPVDAGQDDGARPVDTTPDVTETADADEEVFETADLTTVDVIADVSVSDSFEDTAADGAPPDGPNEPDGGVLADAHADGDPEVDVDVAGDTADVAVDLTSDFSVPPCVVETCPDLAGYSVSCNEREFCEYQSTSLEDWRQWEVVIWVPPGEFIMGSFAEEPHHSNEVYAHRVTFETGFFVDRYEVTASAFADFLSNRGDNVCGEDGTECLDEDDGGRNVEWIPHSSEAVVRTMCENEPGGAALFGCEEHPVAEVTWSGAAAYCEWAGRRLCTEAEWEYAAAGPQRNTYPWGNETSLSQTHAACHEDLCGDGFYGTGPVWYFPEGASWLGCESMAGNVKEWLEDNWHLDYEGAPTDGSAWIRSPPDSLRIIRGGDYNDDSLDVLRTRGRAAQTWRISFDTTGFRCCLSP